MSGVRLRQSDASLWERYQRDPRLERGSEPVLARWARVRALGVSPEGPAEPPVLDATTLRLRVERLDPVLRAARALLEEAAAEFSRHHHTLLVADPQGAIVRRFDGGAFEPVARDSRLIEGATWSEAIRGTNAIGTAVAERASVVVEGCAHWERHNHRLSCSASPVFGPDGALVAVVDATSFSEAASGFAPLAVQSLARNVEAVLQRRAYGAAGRADVLARSLHRFGQPALLLERGGRVRMANAPGRAWLAAGHARALADLWRAAEAGRTRVDLADARLGLEPLRTDDGHVFAALVFVEPRVASPARPRPPAGAPEEDGAATAFARLAGTDARLAAEKQRAARFAATELPVLLLSETGTGKELMARAIHAASPRAAGPFVALNCGAISEALLESELFGYGPGAFTGARADGQRGKIEAAAGGTLFLDEVAEMPPRLQASLLRVLEDGAFYRVGEVEPRHAAFRLVAATCRDLPTLVAEGRFRQDLLFRIRGATVQLPPLRDRTDKVALARTLLARLVAPDPAPPIAPDAAACIEASAWPGNVRELKTALAHALALDPARVRREHLPTGAASPAGATPGPGPTVRESEAAALDRALAGADGNMSEAARRLGVARSTLYRMLRRHGRR